MKRLALLAAGLVLALSAYAADVHKASGVVTRVDAAKNKVTIKHEPIKSLQWPAMTMAFTVKDKAMLEKMPKGKKVDFEFQEQGRDYVITSVK
jgi:Cu(I)/Ag(I) efflux system protein CusF